MKILMFHQHFNTPEVGGAIRSYYLARALVQHGHMVSMITSYNGKASHSKRAEGIEVYYLPISYNNRFTFYARSWSFIKYIFGAIRVASRYKDHDVSYGISAPLTVGLITRWLKFRYHMPYIFEVGDLWPDAPIQLGFVRNIFFQRLLYALEKAIYRQADSIVALSPSIRSAIEGKIPNKKIDLIPNMADCDFYQPEKKNPIVERKFQTNGKFVVSYIGSLGIANGLNYLLNCADTSRRSGLPIQFIICGDGAMLDGLMKEVEQKQLTNITFAGFVNREGVKEVMNVTDAVLVCYKNVPILETGCPNKYFDGLAAGKLIIINFGGWIKREIEEKDCGIYVDPEQPEDFVRKLSPFISDSSLLGRHQVKSRELAEKTYSRKLIGDWFVNVFAKYGN